MKNMENYNPYIRKKSCAGWEVTRDSSAQGPQTVLAIHQIMIIIIMITTMYFPFWGKYCEWYLVQKRLHLSICLLRDQDLLKGIWVRSLECCKSRRKQRKDEKIILGVVLFLSFQMHSSVHSRGASEIPASTEAYGKRRDSSESFCTRHQEQWHWGSPAVATS